MRCDALNVRTLLGPLILSRMKFIAKISIYSFIYNYSNALFRLIKKRYSNTRCIFHFRLVQVRFLFLYSFYSYLMKFFYFVILIINFKMIVKDTSRMLLKENAIPNSLFLNTYIYTYFFFYITTNIYFHVIIGMQF